MLYRASAARAYACYSASNEGSVKSIYVYVSFLFLLLLIQRLFTLMKEPFFIQMPKSIVPLDALLGGTVSALYFMHRRIGSSICESKINLLLVSLDGTSICP